MQRLPDGSLRFSPKDLIAYLEGDFATWCDRLYSHSPNTAATENANGPKFTPDKPDEEGELVIRRGIEHEAAHLARLRAIEPGLIEIEHALDAPKDLAYDRTREAMRNGSPIIVQGELRAGAWMGIADFLHSRKGASALGNHHYEPWDTKLARSAKPYFLLQLCAYVDMLEAMQGKRPEQFGFVFGDNSSATFKTTDVWHYYRRLKRSFEKFQREWSENHRPDLTLDRTHGRWTGLVEKLLEQLDHLSLVAGITRSQMVRLRDAGITTVVQLADSGGDVKRMNARTLTNLREQARMQVATRASPTIKWTPRPSDPDRPRRGLVLLPPKSHNDVFFDIEGFPFAIGGLEYLLGVVTTDGGAPKFRDWWAHDDAQEKLAFEAFVDWSYARWQQDPTLHIYHYASYEASALRRLMGKHGTREFEVDELLRHEVLVDLYPIVLQGFVIGTPSYSLKHVEKLYMPVRTGGVVTAGGSVVEYQKWIDAGEPADPGVSPILGGIRSYNKVDCESTVGLRDWLLERQREAGITWLPPESRENETPREASPAMVLAEQLIARAETLSGEDKRVTSVLAWLLEFHRREEKPWWWHHFDRMKASDETLYDDMDCLAGLVRTETPPRAIKKSTGLEYRFDADQDTKMDADDKCVVAGTEVLCKCSIERFVDRDSGLIELKVGPGKRLPDHLSLIPGSPLPTKILAEGILRYAMRWATDSDCHPALRDLLTRTPPRLTHGRPFLIDESADLMQQGIDAVLRLDRSTLCIQGPPGTGKTTTATEMILALAAGGKRVGIVANSHQVVLNLLECIARLGDERKTDVRLVKVGGENDHPLVIAGRMKWIDSKDAAAEIAEGPLVIGGTAWLFAREDLEGKLDYLFIEEAGQFSLANAVACGTSAANLVLLGDQMQLSQPTQGSHPGESGRSALEYFLEDQATVPPELGLFLGLSHRMHPAVCEFISGAYYEGRLRSAPSTAMNCIDGGHATSIGSDVGVRFMPVVHDGCTQDSEEEIEAIRALVNELLACSVKIKDKPARQLTMADILIVAPFNMQVRALKHRLGPGARVGTVDKFQGQEAPVVIVSMCASTLDDAPRGSGFLLSRNRLNVAISRAQALAVVVGSPRIADARVRSVEELMLVSGWCRIEACDGKPEAEPPRYPSPASDIRSVL